MSTWYKIGKQCQRSKAKMLYKTMSHIITVSVGYKSSKVLQLIYGYQTNTKSKKMTNKTDITLGSNMDEYSMLLHPLCLATLSNTYGGRGRIIKCHNSPPIRT